LLLGQGFISELYEHMGFHLAWKFEKVIELVLAAGVLIASHDRSVEMGKIRDAKAGAGEQTKCFTSPVEIAGWIENCFDRRY
jgi:hypothetical protein